MNEKLISIIIPTYNRSDLLGATLDSVRAQDYKNWECIIVDDGSIDYTLELIEFYTQMDNRIRLLIRPDNISKGANSCRNYGFKFAKGHFVNWFDDDDIMLKNFLSDKISKFDYKTDIVICSYTIVDPLLNILRSIELKQTQNLFKSYALYDLKMITHSIMFRKSLLSNFKLFNSDIIWGEETEFFLRVFYGKPDLNYKIINKSLFLYRQHGSSKSFENESFVPQYRKAYAIIALCNLERGIHLNDQEIIIFSYQQVISTFFRFLHLRYKELAKEILNKLSPLIWRFNKALFIELFMLGNFMVIANRSFYKIEKRLKNYLV